VPSFTLKRACAISTELFPIVARIGSFAANRMPRYSTSREVTSTCPSALFHAPGLPERLAARDAVPVTPSIRRGCEAFRAEVAQIGTERESPIPGHGHPAGEAAEPLELARQGQGPPLHGEPVRALPQVQILDRKRLCMEREGKGGVLDGAGPIRADL